jgi:hypothetical protein
VLARNLLFSSPVSSGSSTIRALAMTPSSKQVVLRV